MSTYLGRVDIFGNPYAKQHELLRMRDMFMPVRCAFCGSVYDLGSVTVTARYADCSMWKSPCCSRAVDDRGETGWKSRRDYVPLDKSTGAPRRGAR